MRTEHRSRLLGAYTLRLNQGKHGEMTVKRRKGERGGIGDRVSTDQRPGQIQRNLRKGV